MARLQAEELSVDATNEAVATGPWDNYEHNEPRLDVLTKALAAMGS
jgi:hypothetical protein